MTLSRQNDPFAVSTPAPDPGGANLSPQERQMYEFMWRHRDRTPTLGYLLSRNVGRWAILAAGLVIAIAAMYGVDAVTVTFDEDEGIDSKPYLAMGVIGFFLGIVARDFMHCQNIRKLWLLEAAIIDFPKVERLLWGEGQSNDLPPTRRAEHDAPLAAIPVEEEPSRVEDPAR